VTDEREEGLDVTRSEVVESELDRLMKTAERGPPARGFLV
jgi:hypothetical protein